MALDSERAKKITLKGLFWEGRDARSFTTWRPRPEVGPCHEDCDERSEKFVEERIRNGG